MATARLGKLEQDIPKYFLGKIIVGLGGFLAIPLLTRGIGVEGYGQLSLWLSIALWTPQIVGGWFQQSILRYHKSYKTSGEYPDYWLTLQIVNRCSFVLAAAVTFILFLFWKDTNLLGTGLVAAIAGLMLIYMYYTAIAQAELQPSTIVWSDFARTALPAGLFYLLLIVDRLNIVTALASTAIALVVANFYYAFRLRNLSASSGHYSRDVLSKLFKYGMPMGMWFVFATGQLFVGRFVLDHYHMRQELGLYSAILDFAVKVGTLLFMPITYALHGLVMSLWADKLHGKARDTIRRAYIYQMGISAVYILATAMCYPIIMSFLFGSRQVADTGTKILLMLISAGVVMVNLSFLSHKGLELSNRTGQMATFMAMASVANLALSLWLTPIIGAQGPAIGLILGYAAYVVATHIMSENRLTSVVRIQRTSDER